MGAARVDVTVNGQAGTASTEDVVVGGGVLFATTFDGTGAPEPDEVWALPGTTSGGTAHVHYANGHNAIQRPVILADGFNHGPSDLAGLYQHFGDFFRELRANGRDVILLGFDQRQASVLHNAALAQQCIFRTIAERLGGEPLVVGGVSMGGMVTRYALARMENDGLDHQTSTYFSIDTPHNGAWIPLILQQLAYFFESLPSGDPEAPAQAELIRSEAAQQLLWGWVPDSKYSGEVATASPVRTEFLAELNRVGSWPRRPRLLGVANGSGDGTGRPLPAGEIAFDWKALFNAASATARFQAAGAGQAIGGMNFLAETRACATTDVPALDGAPGGILASFGLVADALKVTIPEEYRASCFVPTVSAVALDFDPVAWDGDPALVVDDLEPDRSALDDFTCDANSEHGTLTAPLTQWLLDRLT
jgi:hypothetical protein